MSEVRLTAFFVALAALGCATSGAGAGSGQDIPLDAINRLGIGSNDRNSVERAIGKPDLRSDALDNLKYDGPSDKQAWVYFNAGGKGTRASVIFDRATGKLDNAYWFPGEKDPEFEFTKARSLFYDPCFIKEIPAWSRGRAAPNSVLFVGQQSGVVISRNATLGNVESIAIRADKNRKTSPEPGRKCY